MDPKEIRDAVDAAISPLAERLGAIEGKMVSKEQHEQEIKGKTDEIEALKKEAAEKLEAANVEIETLKKKIEETTPPEALSEEALKGKVGADLAYREHVLKALLIGGVTEKNAEEKIKAASDLVVELLKRDPDGNEHGEPKERTVELAPDKIKEKAAEGKEAFEARGKKK